MNNDWKNVNTFMEAEERLKPSLQNQIIAAVLCNICAFSFGTCMGWSSPAFLEIKKTHDLSDEELAWAGGLMPIGCLVSLPIFGYFVRTKGRKPAAYIIGIPLIIGLVMMSLKEHPKWILFGRFLCGFGGAGAISLPPLYVNEICEPRARGFLSSIMMTEFSMGLLLAYCLGAVVSDVYLLSLTLLPFPILFLLGFWFMPETPVFRLRLGQEEEAARALAWLRKLPLNSNEVKEELTQIAARLGLTLPLPPLPPKLIYKGRDQPRPHPYLRSPSRIESNKRSIKLEIQKTHARQVVSSQNPKSTEAPWRLLMKSKVSLKGLGLCFALVTGQSFMGLLAVSAYAAFIFELAKSPMSSDLCGILSGVVTFIGTVCGSLLMDKAGRRFLQISSCIVVGSSHLVLGLFLTAVHLNYDVLWLNWLPLVALPLCVFSFNIGAGIIPFVIISEIFAPEVQDIANNIIMLYVWILCFILLQFFPTCVSAFGLHSVFFFFAGVSFISGVFNYFCLIETKGKSLEEILEALNGKKRVDLDTEQKEKCELQSMLET